MSRSLVPRTQTNLRRHPKWRRVDALLPARQQMRHMQRLRGLSYFAGIELSEINRLLAKRERMVLEAIETKLRQAKASGASVESLEWKAYQLFEEFSEHLTALEEGAGQVITQLITNIERS